MDAAGSETHPRRLFRDLQHAQKYNVLNELAQNFSLAGSRM